IDDGDAVGSGLFVQEHLHQLLVVEFRQEREDFRHAQIVVILDWKGEILDRQREDRAPAGRTRCRCDGAGPGRRRNRGGRCGPARRHTGGCRRGGSGSGRGPACRHTGGCRRGGSGSGSGPARRHTGGSGRGGSGRGGSGRGGSGRGGSGRSRHGTSDSCGAGRSSGTSRASRSGARRRGPGNRGNGSRRGGRPRRLLPRRRLYPVRGHRVSLRGPLPLSPSGYGDRRDLRRRLREWRSRRRSFRFWLGPELVVEVGLGVHPFGCRHGNREGGADGPPPGRYRSRRDQLPLRLGCRHVPANGELFALRRRE
ncbi:MAG: hypothetical protein QOE07_1510, partial [Acidimicrobiaceae bacterium]|nr:hypothetical protein [Acidimicrobiaceae bacterium]